MKIYKYIENGIIKLAFCECVLSQQRHENFYGENTVELSAANVLALGDNINGIEGQYCTIVGDDLATSTVTYNKPQVAINIELDEKFKAFRNIRCECFALAGNLKSKFGDWSKKYSGDIDSKNAADALDDIRLQLVELLADAPTKYSFQDGSIDYNTADPESAMTWIDSIRAVGDELDLLHVGTVSEIAEVTAFKIVSVNTNTGLFHELTCTHFDACDVVMSESSALSAGYTPCSVCNP